MVDPKHSHSVLGARAGLACAALAIVFAAPAWAQDAGGRQFGQAAAPERQFGDQLQPATGAKPKAAKTRAAKAKAVAALVKTARAKTNARLAARQNQTTPATDLAATPAAADTASSTPTTAPATTAAETQAPPPVAVAPSPTVSAPAPASAPEAFSVNNPYAVGGGIAAILAVLAGFALFRRPARRPKPEMAETLATALTEPKVVARPPEPTPVPATESGPEPTWSEATPAKAAKKAARPRTAAAKAVVPPAPVAIVEPAKASAPKKKTTKVTKAAKVVPPANDDASSVAKPPARRRKSAVGEK